MRPDDKLIEAAQTGDEQALGELVRRHIDFAYNIAIRTTGNTDDADDATQQAFVNAWKAIKKFQTGASFKAWIGRIVRNTAIDVIRRKRDVPFSTYENEDDETKQLLVVDDSPSPEDQSVQNEKHRHMHSLLRHIPAHDREIVLLHLRDDLTFREIGDMLEIPLHTVKSRYRRAIIRLQNKYGPSNAPKSDYETYTK